MPKAPAKEELLLQGPAGQLEALLETPHTSAAVNRVAVICHPHPLHEGTMLNKVVHTVARAMNDLGIPALRFNFRGVGQSEGRHANGDGEVDDVLAIVAWARARWPDADVWLAGFSFGAVVAARAAAAAQPARLISIAPAVNILGAKLATRPAMPWLIVQGGDDEIVPADAVHAFVEANQPGPELVMLDGVGHFFHGHLVALRKLLVERLGP